MELEVVSMRFRHPEIITKAIERSFGLTTLILLFVLEYTLRLDRSIATQLKT